MFFFGILLKPLPGFLRVNIFPYIFRHEICLNDLAVCPDTGSIISVGADGQLQMTLSGRLSPRLLQTEFSFNGSRIVMHLKRHMRTQATEEVRNPQFFFSFIRDCVLIRFLMFSESEIFLRLL